MKPPFILLLEDTPSRVSWLMQRIARSDILFVQNHKVKPFLRACEVYGDRVLGIVLDHDLGGYSMPVSLQDEDGLDGVDAVEQCPILHPEFLIWSSNAQEAPRMEQILRARGAEKVVRAVWRTEHEKIEEVVSGWVAKVRAGI